MDTRLLDFDLESGGQVAELWDGEGESHNLGEFAPLPGDLHMLSSTSKSGYEQPITWNPRTGERKELAVADIPGDVDAWQWSKDGRRMLLRQLHEARHQLYV